MAIWSASNIVMTTIGAEILAKVQQGVGSITLSTIRTGAGYVTPANLASQTGVTTPAQVLSLVGRQATAEGSVLEVQLMNTNLAQAYDLYQIGVYVTHPDYTGDQLYMIAQCDTSDPDHIPLPSETVLIMSYSLKMLHSGVATITATFSAAATVTTDSNQTISGVKTFSVSPEVPAPASSASAINKGYADSLDATSVKLAGSQTITGAKTFTGTTVLPTATSVGTVSSTEISYLDGVTSAIQTQINAKAPLASPALTGTPTSPTAVAGTNTTQVSTTAFVTAAISAIVGAPATALNTLQKISSSLGGDGAFSTTINNAIQSILSRLSTAEDDITTLGSSTVKTSTNQTISGVKTFASPPVVPTPVSGTNAANKSYADTKVSRSGDESVSGTKTFLNSPVVPETPAGDTSAVSKSYVANLVNQGVKTTNKPSFAGLVVNGNVVVSGTVTATKVVGATYG